MDKKIIVITLVAFILSIAGIVTYQAARNMAGPAVEPEPSAALTSAKDTGRKPAQLPKEDDAIKSAEETIVRSPDSARAEEAYWKLASIYEKRGDLLKLKDIYRQIIEKFSSSGDVLKAQEAMEANNMNLLASSIETPDSFIYEVQKGDSLVKIAKKFNTTVELISKANGLKSGILRYGKKLKITKLKFSIVIDKSQNILTLKADGDILKTYSVSTGKDSSTPVGTFKIINKIIDPPWYPAGGKVIPSGDPKNVLGTRWLGISKPSYGIHGTIDPASIGKSVTDGCVRMRNAEVEELYSIVPEGTEVIIVD